MLILVRHGQTAANRGGLLQGRIDPPLTELGTAQAAAAAATLAGCGATRIVSSPLVRAVATATVIGDTLGLEVEIDDRIVEIDYGSWDGRALTDIEPATWASWRNDPHFAPPGGESLHSVATRAGDFAHDVLERGGVTLAVSHVSPIKAIAAWALGADDSATWRMHLDVASITRVTTRGAGPCLLSFNEVPHNR